MLNILTINGGSSSIRFAFFTAESSPKKLLDGKVDRIGSSGTRLTVNTFTEGKRSESHPDFNVANGSAAAVLVEWLSSQPLFATVQAIGHRIVHGMQHARPQRIDSDLLAELKTIISYDPEHLPQEIELIEALRKKSPQLLQVACFDTAFHRTLPRVATILPIPRRYQDQGVQRYGFHGLSYTYLMSELRRFNDPAATQGRVILAHLGNGASLAAVRNGESIDTSMGFTPAAGLVMSTRTGDLDPGIANFLEKTQSMTFAAYQKMVNHESGLLGVSETSSDIRDLLAAEIHDVRAAEAVALFCYQVKKWIGSFVAALGGLDTLVFAGGIGENAPVIRSRICEGLEFLGIELHADRNLQNAPLICAGRVAVRVIPTDEGIVIAKSTVEMLQTTRM